MSFLDDAITQVQSAKAAMLSAQDDCDAAIFTLRNPPPPPLGLIDCTTLTMPAPGKSLRWNTVKVLPERIAQYFPKAIGGFPYDIKIWDANGLREHSTENDKVAWADPLAAKSWKSYDAPVYFLPRTYNSAQGEITLTTLADLPWRRWLNGVVVDDNGQPNPAFVHHIPNVSTTFSGPFSDRNWGGAIGQAQYFVTHYNYGAVRENFYWMIGSGWFGWEHQSKDANGNWATDKSSIHTTFIADNPVPQDPLGIISMRFF